LGVLAASIVSNRQPSMPMKSTFRLASAPCAAEKQTTASNNQPHNTRRDMTASEKPMRYSKMKCRVSLRSPPAPVEQTARRAAQPSPLRKFAPERV
jgi:hypothetical protein